MNTNKIISLLIVLILISGCANSKFSKKYNKPFKHNTPLIKDDIKSEGKAEIAKTLELGPKPVDGDTRKLGKRKKITSEQNKNYLIMTVLISTCCIKKKMLNQICNLYKKNDIFDIELSAGKEPSDRKTNLASLLAVWISRMKTSHENPPSNLFALISLP